MKRKSFAGITSVSLPIFIVDSSSGTGAGLSGLVFNTASLVAEYRRQGQSAWTAISLVTNTLGTYTSGGFIADGSLAGAYEFCPPNAAVAAGARWVAIRLYGAANMKPVLIEIELDAVNYQDAAAFGLTAVPVSLTQAVPVSNTAQTLGDCLNAARVQGFGPWVLDKVALTLTLKNSDGTTARVFNVDSATAPTQRT